VNVKGSALIHGRAWIGERFGLEALGRFEEGLDPARREVLGSTMRGHSWYPVSLWNAMAEAVSQAGGHDALRDFAREVAQRDLSIAYRVLLSVGSPTILFRRAGLFWTKYFDGGVFESVPEGERRFRNYLRAGVDAKADPTRLLCEVVIPAWQEQSLALAGAAGGKSRHVRCRFEGAPACEFEVTWDA
jgi:hypothetical protein